MYAMWGLDVGDASPDLALQSQFYAHAFKQLVGCQSLRKFCDSISAR
jgi:hypothetical protein